MVKNKIFSMRNYNYLIVICFLAFNLSCKKDSPPDDFIGTWQLISVNGEASEKSIPGAYKWFKSKTISSHDNIVTINTFSYSIHWISDDYWQILQDTIDTEIEYEFNVLMDIKDDKTLKINEVYTKLSDNSVYSGSINSYWLSTEGALESYLLKLSFMERDPGNFSSYIFFKSDLPVALDEYMKNDTCKISANIEYGKFGRGVFTYIFKKIN